MLDVLRRASQEETGSTIVLVAGALPVLILLAALVLDVGNWWLHKRHLQVRADAAALAAGGDFTYPCVDSSIRARAAQYGAIAGSPVYNEPAFDVEAANIHQLINSPTFFGQGESDDTVAGEPCTTRQVDVKMTETGLGAFFGMVPLVPNINAHARVEVRQLEQGSNFIPLTVLDPDWKRARVTFFDESNGDAVLGTRDLVKAGTDGAGRTIWDNGADPLSVDFRTVPDERTRVGVRLALSANPTTVECGSEGVFCYDRLLFLRGHRPGPAISAGTEPRARNVVLTPGSCEDAYFTLTATTAQADCTVSVQATVDWGVADPGATYNAQVTATLEGGSAVQLTRSGTTWSGTLSLPPDAGARTVTLDWRATKGTLGGKTCQNGNKACTGSFGVAQRSFSAGAEHSGPVQAAEVWTGTSIGTAVRQNSFAVCPQGETTGCTYPIITRFAVPSNLESAQAVSDPVYRMRFNEGSQTQVLDCDDAIPTVEEELELGCGGQPASHPTRYVINAGEPCSSYNNPGALPDPSPCVVAQTGQFESKIGKGLNRRILGDEKPSACTSPNRWSEFPDLPDGDPRLVYVVLTSYGSFDGSGNQGFPVQRLAAFYITGWQGNPGFGNPCQGAGDDGASRGEVVGHFIKYVQKVNEGGAGDELCDLGSDSLGLCVPVLTR